MAFFNSNTVSAKFKDLRTNMKSIKFAKDTIEVEFDGIFANDLVRAVKNKASQMERDASKNYRKSKGTLRWLFHENEKFMFPRPESECTFEGDDLLNMVYDYRTVEQIAPDAFKLKGKCFDIQNLENACYDCDYEEFNLEKTIDSCENSNTSNELREELAELRKLKIDITKQLELQMGEREKMVKAIKKGDSAVLDKLREMTVYVTPMGLSLEPSLRFTSLPEIILSKPKHSHLVNGKLHTMIHGIKLYKSDSKADDDYHLYWKHTQMRLRMTPHLDSDITQKYAPNAEVGAKMRQTVNGYGLERDVEGYFKADTLCKLSDTEFEVVNYITGRVEKFYIGVHDVTTDPQKAYDVDPLNPSKQDWFMNL